MFTAYEPVKQFMVDGVSLLWEFQYTTGNITFRAQRLCHKVKISSSQSRLLSD